MSEFTEEARKQKQTFINIQQSIEEQDETYQQPFVHKTMEDAALQTTKTRQELLNEKVNFVTSMMPTKLKSKTDEDLPPKKQGMDSFPPALKRAITALSAWEKVKAISSKPVKEAAKKLSETKTDTEGAACMEELLYASIKYLDKRVDQWHLWWGDGRKRLRQVKGFIEQAYLFSATAPSIYGSKMGNCMDGFLRSSVEKPERYQRHVEKAEYMRDVRRKSLLVDQNSEESVHIKVEKELSQERFDDIVDNMTSFSGTHFDELKFGSTEEAIANKKENISILVSVQHNEREFLRGLALGYDIGVDKLRTAQASLKVANYLMDHLEEVHDIDEVWKQMAHEERLEAEEDVKKLNHYYGITHCFSLVSNHDTAQKYFKDLKYIENFKKSEEFPAYLKKINRKADDPDVDFMITMELINRFNQADPRAFFTDMKIDSEYEDDYYIELERRKAKGKLLAETEASTARTAELFSYKIKEATRENRYEDIGEIAQNLITLNLKELMDSFMKQPALINSHIAEIKMVKDHMPYITANAQKCGISPDELAKLMAITTVVDDFDKKVNLEKSVYASGFVYVDEQDLMTKEHLDSMYRYAKHIHENKDPKIANEGQKLLDLRVGIINKKLPLDPVERLQSEIVKKEDLIMSDGMKELENQKGFSVAEMSYTPAQLEEKRILRVSHIDNMLNVCRTYLKNEKSREGKSRRYNDIMQNIKKLEDTKRFLTKGYNYYKGIAEVFDYEDKVMDDTLRGLRGYLLEVGNSKDSILDVTEYNRRRDVAVLSLNELINKAAIQMDMIKDTKENAAYRKSLNEIIKKRTAQRDKLQSINFDTYLDMYATNFFIDFMDILSIDSKKQGRMDAQWAKMGQLAVEFGAQKVELRSEPSVDFMETSAKHNAYIKNRLENSPFESRVQDLQDKIASGELVLEESMISDMVSDIYSEMTIDDVKEQYRCAGMLTPAALPILGLGAEDTSTVMEYVQKFFEEPGFAAQMGLREEHMEAYNKFSAQCNEIMIISTRVFMMENFIPSKLTIDTKDMPAEKKASIEKQKNLYEMSLRHMRYSANNLALQKFQYFCQEFFPFLIDNGINVLMTKDDGRQKDYMEQVRKDEEKQVDISGMTEKEAAEAKVRYYDEAFETKYNGASLSTFSAIMRQNYYNNKTKETLI